MAPVLVFDIETIPDIAGLRAAWGFDAALPDAEVAEQAFARRRERTGGSDFCRCTCIGWWRSAVCYAMNAGFRYVAWASPTRAKPDRFNSFSD